MDKLDKPKLTPGDCARSVISRLVLLQTWGMVWQFARATSIYQVMFTAKTSITVALSLWSLLQT